MTTKSLQAFLVPTKQYEFMTEATWGTLRMSEK